MRKTLKKRHSWTDEELNILSYLRHTRDWRFKKIQTSYFPSLSPNALLGAYWRLSTEDRIRRASRITTPIIAARNTGEDLSGSPKLNPHAPVSHRGQVARGQVAIALLLSQKHNIETLAFTAPSPASGGDPLISDNSSSSRYKLRPNRPSIFPPRKPEYLVDRRRFPHFFRSYKYSLNRQGIPDSDYTPPSRMPTPSSSDRSVSIV
ncbi:hypothetical protein N7541_009338 [Penicillium brevicompactum]|uniref:Uncharacterized protein n=1 Tax=Penicillium brevicompactum TaxID=5074 RepID=A0A9W9QPI9_PENBR|nr:hypothetical protein N7541_009338 [Penicillium brevicompactum]